MLISAQVKKTAETILTPTLYDIRLTIKNKKTDHYLKWPVSFAIAWKDGIIHPTCLKYLLLNYCNFRICKNYTSNIIYAKRLILWIKILFCDLGVFPRWELNFLMRKKGIVFESNIFSFTLVFYSFIYLTWKVLDIKGVFLHNLSSCQITGSFE